MSDEPEIDRIHTEATGAVLMHVCQVLDGLRAALSHEKKRLGYSQTFVVNGSVERECQGLIELIHTDIANNLPFDPVKAVEAEDHFELLDDDAKKEVAARVRNTVRELLGVFDKEQTDD